MTLRMVLAAAALMCGWLVTVGVSACQPAIVGIDELLDGQARAQQRFSRIAMVEVVATQAQARRLNEFAAWRAEMRQALAERVGSEERQRQLDASWKPIPGGPPKPPPESPFPLPLMMPNVDPVADIRAEVFEYLLGTGPLQVEFPLGGQCGRIPAVGEQLLAFYLQSGGVLVLPPPDGRRRFEDALIERIRGCMQEGVCQSRSQQAGSTD